MGEIIPSESLSGVTYTGTDGMHSEKTKQSYWAIQVGLLTPLTFAWHRLSPFAAFTSSACFFTMEGGDSEFANFTLPTLKAFLEARSHNVSGNKQ